LGPLPPDLSQRGRAPGRSDRPAALFTRFARLESPSEQTDWILSARLQL
jgi:hypothetical protein